MSFGNSVVTVKRGDTFIIVSANDVGPPRGAGLETNDKQYCVVLVNNVFAWMEKTSFESGFARLVSDG